MDEFLKKGLQQELYLETVQVVQDEGWEYLNEGGLIAFKSPGAAPFIDFAYGDISFLSYQRFREFFGEKPFKWMVQEGQSPDLLQDFGFVDRGVTFEMGLDLSKYTHVSSDIKIEEVHTLKDFAKWTFIVSKWLKIDDSFLDEFFFPLIKTGNCFPFLGFYEGKPVTTGLLWKGRAGGYIDTVGTLPEYRGKGVASFLVRTLLNVAKEKHLGRIFLYSSDAGVSMYEKIGFKTVQVIQEFSCNTKRPP